MSNGRKTPLLDQINSPADLRTMTVEELEQLARELRDELLDVVSQTGGHLASSLGVAELTIALHATLNTPRDRIVWDVGHQTYGHKILTGRRDSMLTLRKTGGLSGFAKRTESEYDTFGAGHASTSISAALGMAVARDRRGSDEKVVAVIGDGSLTGGMAFEALNNAGHMDTDLLVILNDNEMSISPNVGALSLYLSRLITNPAYNTFKRDMESLMKAIPRVGETIFETARRVQNSAAAFIKAGHLFEELGFQYIGPIDGHNLAVLMETLAGVKKLRRPVLLHLLTKKGKGYEPAEADPVRYHGVTPFKLEPEKQLSAEEKRAAAPSKPAPPKYTDVFGDALVQAGKADERVIAITAAMPGGTGVIKFAKTFPDRCFDVGIAEQHAVTFAAGLATQGMVPVCAIYSTFLQRAYDQLIHDVCIQNLPVRFVMDRAGLVGADGPTHHGVFDVAYLRAVPNLVCVAPKDEEELRAMTRWIMRYDEHPVALRYPRGSGVGVPMTDALPDFEVGKAEVVRPGSDVVIVALGTMVHPALAAADALAQEDVSAAVINLRFYKPLDADCIRDWTARCGRRVVTVEEGCLQGGVGEGISRIIAEAGLADGLRLRCLGVPDAFQPHGSPADLLDPLGLTDDGIAGAAREVLGIPSDASTKPAPLHATLP